MGTPVATGVPTEESKEEGAEIYELKKATADMLPILVWYNKPKDLLAFGKKQTKDPEVEACDAMGKDLWKRWVITELSKEFVCVRVNTRKADKALLRGHRVARAPVVEILDFNLKPIYFSSSPRLKHNSLAKVMDRCRKKVEDAVKKLAKSDEDTPLVQRAKNRAQVIETRECYDKGAVALGKRDWNKSADQFNKGLAIEQDSHWKHKCKTGLLEIKAGKLFVQAERLYKMRQFSPCKDKLDTIVSDYKEAKYFAALAKEMLTKVNKKVRKR
ncbi:MAG: hypothetical protein ACYTFG_14230 [Planctomycetota bacterium]